VTVLTPSDSQPAEASSATAAPQNPDASAAGGDSSAPTDFQLDPEAAGAVDLARAAAVELASEEVAVGESTEVGDYLGARADGELTVVHGFRANLKGYLGWFWAVTVARVPGFEPTVDEVVLLPGEDALLAPAWVPWSERLQPGDLSPGDVLPTPAEDPRLAPGYLLSDDPAVEEVAFELGQGRHRVFSRLGRDELAERWYEGPGGPDTPMAKQAPAHCGSCGFFLPLAGSLRALFGACGNEIAETDGRVVSVDHGCGAHSEAVVEVAEDEHGEVYDDEAVDLIETGSLLAGPSEAAEPAESDLAEIDDLEVSELGEPATDLGEQVEVELDELAVDALDAGDAERVDAEDQPGQE
jgi:hypothetical protein